MKFKAPPNHVIRVVTPAIQRALGRKYIFFDENGELETEKPLLIKILTRVAERSDSLISIETAPAASETPKTENNADASAETGEEIKLLHCKKCDFTCENWGELMAHYRADHPKDKEE
jgi:hypothetical protein